MIPISQSPVKELMKREGKGGERRRGRERERENGISNILTMAFSVWCFTGWDLFFCTITCIIFFIFYNKQILILKSPKGKVITDKNIDRRRAASLLPEPSVKSPSPWKNHPICTGDVCHPGLSLTSSYLADKEKDGEGALSE